MCELNLHTVVRTIQPYFSETIEGIRALAHKQASKVSDLVLLYGITISRQSIAMRVRKYKHMKD